MTIVAPIENIVVAIAAIDGQAAQPISVKSKPAISASLA
jgi:hypothetical protein